MEKQKDLCSFDNVSDEELKEQIEKQRILMKEMQEQFVKTIDTLQKQFDSYVDESSQIQHQMVERIKELKKELNAARDETSKYLSKRRSPQAAQRSKFHGSTIGSNSYPKKHFKAEHPNDKEQ